MNRTAFKSARPGAAPVSEPLVSERSRPAPLVTRRVDRHVVSLVDPDCYEAEQYRMLRYVLEERRVPDRGLAVAICSPAAGDGKSLTALNLAATLAQATNAKVLLVDADLRRESASLKANLGFGRNVSLNPGLSDAVQHVGMDLQDVARPLTGLNLSLVFAGTNPPAPYEIFRSPRFGMLLAGACADYDYVILDTPPVVPVSDCRVIAKHMDGLLMVVAAHETPRSMLEEALTLLGPDRLWGLVYNGGDLMPRRYYGYYGYGKPTAMKPKHVRRHSAPRSTMSRGGGTAPRNTGTVPRNRDRD